MDLEREPLGTWTVCDVPGGHRMWLDLGDYGVSQPCSAGVYEPVETAFMRKMLKPGGTFVDVGANVGWFTIQAAGLVGPSGHVHAFEPRPNTAERLRLSAALNDYHHIDVHQVALGAEAGRMRVATLLSAHNPGGTWLLATPALDANLTVGYERFDVDVIALDTLELPRCELLKIDIEGAEQLALSGAQHTLRRLRPIIISEINPGPLIEVSQVTPRQYVDFLGTLGYRAHTMLETGLGEALPAGWADGLDHMLNVAFVPH